MKYLTIKFTVIFFLLTTILLAQELNIKKLKTQKTSGANNTNSTQAIGDKVKFMDEEGNILMGIQDEGSFGSIWLPDSTGAPGTITNKIYNVNGTLHFNGSALSTAGSGAGGWIDDGTIVRLSTITDKVGIGTSSPITSLHVAGTEGVLFGGSFGSGTAANLGLGTRFMWYPKKSALRAGSVDGTQWDDGNIGDYSTAFGVNTIASGLRSTSLGYITTASGDHSTSMGAQTTASGNFSTSLGRNSTASGITSTAMGRDTKAEAYLSTVVGRFNVGGGTPNSWVATEPLFEIGNGADDANRANAVTVLKNGNVGIGITSPTSKLHVVGIDGVVFEGTNGSGSIPTTNTGTKMMWYPGKSAFRAGTANVQWSDVNIGTYSTAFGGNTTASGSRSMAFGEATSATGDYSTSFGLNTKAESYMSTAIGKYNVGGGTSNLWVSTDPLFEIGIGTDGSNRENAMIVLKNGNVGLGANNPGYKLSVNGTIRMSGLKMASGATNGYVLTTDANGNGTWQAAPSGVTKIDDLSDAKYDGSSLFLGNGAGVYDDAGASDGIKNQNTAIGKNALSSNTTGSSNTATGYQSINSNTTGSYNTATGHYSLKANTTGNDNTAAGFYSLNNNTTGNSNTAIGSFSLNSNTTGSSNTATGFHSLYNNTTGNNNTGIGLQANYYNEEGSRNTIIGYQAGRGNAVHNKSGNVFLGYKAGYSETGDDKLFIENSSSSSPLIWGDFANDRIVINGNASNGNSNYKFYVNGDAGGNTSWNNLSDERLKKDVTTISNALEKVKKMRGVNYRWKDEDKFSKGLQIGFIAQEANEVIPEVVDDSGEYFSMQYAPITALLVEAVKEQETRIINLEKENEKIKIQNAELKTALLKSNTIEKEVKLLKQILNNLVTDKDRAVFTQK